MSRRTAAVPKWTIGDGTEVKPGDLVATTLGDDETGLIIGQDDAGLPLVFIATGQAKGATRAVEPRTLPRRATSGARS